MATRRPAYHDKERFLPWAKAQEEQEDNDGNANARLS